MLSFVYPKLHQVAAGIRVSRQIVCPEARPVTLLLTHKQPPIIFSVKKISPGKIKDVQI